MQYRTGSNPSLTVEKAYATQDYVNSEEKGINASGNFTGSGGKLGVGQRASGNLSSWATSAKGGTGSKYLNADNSGNNGVVKGIVKDTLTSDGQLQYNVTHPKTLFSGGIGSTPHTNYELAFSKNGDTYTLQYVRNKDNGKNVTGDLTQFSRYTSFNEDYPLTDKTFYSPVYSNNFWPMDDVQGADPHMGKSLKQYRFLYNNGSELQKNDAPNPSDDNLQHNWHFGMTYEVYFTIGDYTGPMEVYFRGDDDLWLFIDGQLAIDIGGIHASVGQTIDVRTWMENKRTSLRPQYGPHHENLLYGTWWFWI